MEEGQQFQVSLVFIMHEFWLDFLHFYKWDKHKHLSMEAVSIKLVQAPDRIGLHE